MKKDKAVEKGMTKGEYNNFNHSLISGYWSKIIAFILSKDKRLNKKAYPIFIECLIKQTQITAKAKEEEIDKIPNNRFGFKYKRMCENIRKTEEQIKQLQKENEKLNIALKIYTNKDYKTFLQFKNKIKQLQKDKEDLRGYSLQAMNKISKDYKKLQKEKEELRRCIEKGYGYEYSDEKNDESVLVDVWCIPRKEIDKLKQKLKNK